MKTIEQLNLKDGKNFETLKKFVAGMSLSLATVFTTVDATAQNVKVSGLEKNNIEQDLHVSDPLPSDTLLVPGFSDKTSPELEFQDLKGIDGDDVGDDENKIGENVGNDGGEAENHQDKKGSNFAVHGILQVGTGLDAGFADVCSDKMSLFASVNMSDTKTGLGFSAVRLDDFSDDPANPASRVLVLNPNWKKQFLEGKLSVGVDGKYNMFDKTPQSNFFSPDVVCSYTTDNGWSFEGVYTHKFKKGTDSDAFRLSISKKVNDALKLTGQGRYESGYDKHFFGRIIVDINLGSGFGCQMSCIAKHGEITPTFGLVYKY